LPKLFELQRHHVYVASLFEEKLEGGHSAVELGETTNKRFLQGMILKSWGSEFPRVFFATLTPVRLWGRENTTSSSQEDPVSQFVEFSTGGT
jgi:hypothetical protein